MGNEEKKVLTPGLNNDDCNKAKEYLRVELNRRESKAIINKLLKESYNEDDFRQAMNLLIDCAMQ